MFCRFLVALCLIAASTPGHAENYVVGPKGGVYCKTPDELSNQIMSAMKGTHESFPGCGVLNPGTPITTSYLDKSSGIVVGAGTSPNILGGVVFAFTTVEGDGAAAPPAKAAPPKAPAGDPSRTYKVIGPEDVRNTPGKWVGRDLAFKNIHVYWVQDDDVRFITHAMVTVFAKNVSGDEKDLNFLRTNCETSKEADLPKCRVTIHFSYDKFDEDHPTPTVTRLVVDTSDIAVLRR